MLMWTVSLLGQTVSSKRRWAGHVFATIMESDPVASKYCNISPKDLVAQQAFKRFLRVLRSPKGKEIVRSMKEEFFLKEAEFHPKPEVVR